MFLKKKKFLICGWGKQKTPIVPEKKFELFTPDCKARRALFGGAKISPKTLIFEELRLGESRE